ncbi:MAG: hypothetical protein U0X76_11455 [Bacteroidia bacterium]
MIPTASLRFRKEIVLFLLPILLILSDQSVFGKKPFISSGEITSTTVTFKEIEAYDRAHPETRKNFRGNSFEEEEEEGDVMPELRVPRKAIIERDPFGTMTTHRNGAQGSATTNSAPPALNFNAIDDNISTIPPDVAGAVGPNHIMTAVNSQVKISNLAGTQLSIVSLDAFWATLGNPSVFDPKLQYDPFNNRWIFTATANGGVSTSSLLMGVSVTNDPTGTWKLYKVLYDATGTNWLDYPSLGFNKDWIVVNGNVFSIAAGAFVQTEFFVFKKADLYSGVVSPGLTRIPLAGSGGTICPAITYDNTISTIYMLQNYNGNSGGSGYIRMYTITGAIGSETVTAGSLISTPNPWASSAGGSTLDFAPQSGSAHLINTNDSRMQKVIYRNGSIWGLHTVFLPAATPTRASVQWWQVTTAAAITQRGRIDDATGVNFYAFPSIDVNTNNDAVIGCAKFSSTTFASACYAVRFSSDAVNTFQTDYVFKSGLASYYKTYSGTRNRWGDYTTVVVDPTNQTDFWTCQEYALTPSGGFDRWGTWWAKVNGACSAPATPGAITGSASVCSGATGVAYSIAAVSGATGYTWTLPTGASITSGANTNSIVVTFGSTSGTVSVTANNTCGSSAASTLSVTVNPNVAASVSIAASPSTGICSGTNVTFTATPTNGGASPSYQWKKNGVNVGTNSSTYSDAALTNGNTIQCVMTSNASCVTGSPASSNTLTMTVTTSVAASVSIAASPSGAICSGTSVTFTATPTNGGAAPGYQWKKNGTNVGTNSTTYTDAALVNSDIITCVMTSNATCATGSPATSNAITMTVNPNVTASVSIAASPAGAICSGTNVTFTATPTNGGASPTYQWKKNGVNVGTNSATYSDAALATGNTITCTMTSNASCVSGSPATSNTITMTVNANVAASVSIAASPSGTICSGTNVTFTATPTNGGASPTYQWKKNGVNVGTNSATYSDATLANGNTITCTMTSNASCVTGSPATSNTITMAVTTSVAASVFIAASPSGAICSGTSVTFTATPTNGGAAPAYQWKKNGSNVGTNSTTYTDAGLANSDVITCVMTSNATCATGSPATSNAIIMTVNANVAASVSIAASPSGAICSGTNVTFTATPTNGGASPTYQWKKNGVNVGTNSTTYSDAALANGNTITCTMTSNASCVTGSPATSNTITMTVNANVAASVSIAASPSGAICSGTSVTFTATPTNGGAAPAYQWKKNGTNVGTNSTTYTDAALANSDVITCVLTSNASCVTGSPATSNAITMTVNPNVAAGVFVSASPSSTICSGTSVTFTATPTNGGAAPSYQWKKNGSNVGTNSTTYTDAALANSDVITCVMTSNATCATGSPATSNAIIMTVNANVAASVSIAASPSGAICSGTNVTFTATPTNGGASPIYQWKKNGVNVGTNSATYSDATLANGNTITCTMTSNASCVTGSPATSNTITMTVNTSVAASVSIAASPSGAICAGTNVTFTATPTNGGASPDISVEKERRERRNKQCNLQ